MRGFWCSGDSTSQRILDVLESFYLRLWDWDHKIVLPRLDACPDSLFFIRVYTNEAKYSLEQLN